MNHSQRHDELMQMAAMRAFTVIVACFVVIHVTLDGCYGYQCCSSYTDLFGDYHPTELCENYCCWKPDLSKYKECCDDSWRRVPEEDQDSCLELWIREHVWVPIVGGLVLLGLIVLLTCCCCCGCCACCRRSASSGLVIHSAVPQTHVVMSSTQTTNVMHAGYDQ